MIINFNKYVSTHLKFNWDAISHVLFDIMWLIQWIPQMSTLILFKKVIQECKYTLNRSSKPTSSG